MNVVYAFMRAIRAGAIHPRHSSTLLAHYGRLGPAFDSCSKAVVDVLREEGMNKKNGEVVVAVVSQALREVSYLHSISISLFLHLLPRRSPWYLIVSFRTKAIALPFPNSLPRASLLEGPNSPSFFGLKANMSYRFI